MYLIKDYRTDKYYKTKYSIVGDKLCSLHSLPFIKAGVMTEEESRSSRLCTDKFPFIEEVMRFDARRNTWMRDCEWFSWLVTIEKPVEK